MLKCVCDLCSRDIGTMEYNDPKDRDQLKIIFGGTNMFIGDVCEDCYKRLCDFLNLPKDKYPS